MQRRIASLALLVATLSSCSYGYELLAVAQGGKLAFIVNPRSDHHPSCLREIEVVADDRAKAKANPDAGDDLTRVGYGTYWFQTVDYDDACANRFPVAYGATLKGRPQQYGIVKAKPLWREVIYEVTTTTGATGYGRGRFIVHSDGHIENLAQR
jgi:hypothetical protein